MQAAIEIGAHSGGETVKMVSSGPSSLDMMMTEQSSAHRIPSGDVSPLVNVAVNDSDRRFPELRVTRDDHDLANGMTHGHAQFTARIVILDILCATHLLVCHTSACVPHICPIVLRSYSPSRSAFLQANRAFTKSLYCCLFSYQSNCRIPVAQDGCLIRSNASSRDTQAEIASWGTIWAGTTKGNGNPKPSNCFDKKQGMDFGTLFDRAFGQAISSMLGGIPVVRPDNDALLPPQPDCVEVGKTRIVGGIRAQNFDTAYRPDGPRIIYDSKTLNDAKSIQKNWQNMVNDLATEASTVHTRFPYCIVAFIVLFPRPALASNQERNLIRTLERLGSRKDELDQTHLAEAIAMIIWDPVTGRINPDVPAAESVLRLDTIQERIYPHYKDRYQNLPPHDV